MRRGSTKTTTKLERFTTFGIFRPFDSLVSAVVMYGAELWGWREWEKLEKVQLKNLKWSLGLDSCTPTYIILAETDGSKIRTKAGLGAVRYEEKTRSSTKELGKE